MKFYVYLLINPINNKVFYVGKGKKNRMYEHRKDSIDGTHHNKHLQYTILKLIRNGLQIKYKKIFVTENESKAFAKETETIQFYGLNNLCNLTYGGKGSTGYKHTLESLKKMTVYASRRNWVGEKNPNYGGGNWTEEAKKNFSEYQKQHLLGAKNPFFGKKHKDSSRAMMSKYQRGKTLSEEQKKKISEHNPWKGKKRPEHSIKMSGENNPRAKLNYEQVRIIRSKYKTGGTSYRKLARDYKVDPSTIADIIKKKIWKAQNTF